MRRPSPPAARAAAPTADRDDDPDPDADGGQEPRSGLGPDGSSRPPTVAPRRPPRPAAARTGMMQTRAWVISQVVGGVENLRPPHGPCPPSSGPCPPSSAQLRPPTQRL